MSVRVKYSSELYHHGIKGQKWGVRRYQHEDGSYTEEGLKRYGRYHPAHDPYQHPSQDAFVISATLSTRRDYKHSFGILTESRKRWEKAYTKATKDPSDENLKKLMYSEFAYQLAYNRALRKGLSHETVYDQYISNNDARRKKYRDMTIGKVEDAEILGITTGLLTGGAGGLALGTLVMPGTGTAVGGAVGMAVGSVTGEIIAKKLAKMADNNKIFDKKKYGSVKDWANEDYHKSKRLLDDSDVKKVVPWYRENLPKMSRSEYRADMICKTAELAAKTITDELKEAGIIKER